MLCGLVPKFRRTSIAEAVYGGRRLWSCLSMCRWKAFWCSAFSACSPYSVSDRLRLPHGEHGKRMSEKKNPECALCHHSGKESEVGLDFFLSPKEISWCGQLRHRKVTTLSAEHDRQLQQIDSSHGQYLEADCARKGAHFWRTFFWASGFVCWSRDMCPPVCKTKILGVFYAARLKRSNLKWSHLCYIVSFVPLTILLPPPLAVLARDPSCNCTAYVMSSRICEWKLKDQRELFPFVGLQERDRVCWEQTSSCVLPLGKWIEQRPGPLAPTAHNVNDSKRWKPCYFVNSPMSQ